MKQIPIYGREGIVAYALVDDEDYDLVVARRWVMLHDRVASWGHDENGALAWTEMHRLILAFPTGRIIHVNGDKRDNRRANLRIATQSDVMARQRKQDGVSSRYKGVTWDEQKRKWRAQLGHKGKKHFLGYHDTQEGAARAYDDMARKVWVDMARLNFPDD